jgi:hypothetical protein
MPSKLGFACMCLRVPPLWRICSLDRSFRWCFILGGCVAVTHITFHVGTCDQTHAALTKIQPSPSGLTPLTAINATSLPDHNFHTSEDCAAAPVSYARDLKCSRDATINKSVSCLDYSLIILSKTTCRSHSRNNTACQTTFLPINRRGAIALWRCR